jgi:hypothetical protein
VWESIESVPGLYAFIACVVCATVVVVKAIGGWRRHQAVKLETGLKREMIERGMSADDIERVMGARLGDEASLGETGRMR